MRNGTIVLLCTLLLASTAAGQTDSTVQPVSLAEKHTIFLSLGMKTNSRTTVSVSPGTVHVESGGVGLIGYGYWFDEEWQLNFSAGAFGVQSDVGGPVAVSSRVFVPLLFGISYYPAALKMGKSGRPYVGLSGGAYTGILSRTGGVVGAETVTESVVGGRFAIGVDIFLGWFRIGPLIGYHLVGEFQEVVGEKTDFSGAEFALVLGVML
ncbi:MAG: hypothetical protein KAJ12_03690 [Bacteroidetes bacterium]|nr:hypothetical protein [Bacteroidota bacterium]